jgi:hypothetical protein
MIKALIKENYWRKMNPRIFDNYEEMIKAMMPDDSHSCDSCKDGSVSSSPACHPREYGDPGLIVSKKFSKDVAQPKTPQLHILFSPSAASFEKFKNEFDRAQKFVKVLKSSGLIG